MKLSDYIKAQRGNAKALAEKLNVHKTIISQIAANSEGTSPARCVEIEQATGGQVSRKDLRKDWSRIWPELEYDCCKQHKKTKKAESRVGR